MNKNIDMQIYERRSENFLNRDEFEKAVVIHKRLITKNPRSFRYHFIWAQIRRDQDKYRSSELKFREVIILYPQNAESHLAYNNLGNVLTKQGKYEEAISSYVEGLKLRANDPNITHNLAICYTEKGDYKEAIEWYEKSLMLSPSDASTHNCMGYLYFLQGKYNEAILKFDDAIQNDPQYATPYYNKAISLFCVSDIREESKNAFQRGIRCLTGENIQKLRKLNDSVNLYNTEMDRVRKELGLNDLRPEVRVNLEKTQKGLEYILELLRIEVGNRNYSSKLVFYIFRSLFI